MQQIDLLKCALDHRHIQTQIGTANSHRCWIPSGQAPSVHNATLDRNPECPINTMTDTARQIIQLLDLTNLNDVCVPEDIDLLCEFAITEAGPVAAVCLWPQFVNQASRILKGTGVGIATVVNFPSGNEDAEQVASQAQKAIQEGADEIDLVMPYERLLKNETSAVAKHIGTVRNALPTSVLLKVILETGELKTPDYINLASEIAIGQGADFIKTSTGKCPVSATPAAADTMLEAIANSSKNIGFKASGGIRTIEQANVYLQLAESKLGKDWIHARHFRFGASGLLQDALAQLPNADGTGAVPADTSY